MTILFVLVARPDQEHCKCTRGGLIPALFFFTFFVPALEKITVNNLRGRGKMVQTVADYVISQLAEWGVNTAFGLPGDSFFPLVNALATEDRIKFYTVRNETAAGYMASAYSKAAGKPALCLADGGPGAVNLLNGLFDATNDGVPVIALTGQVQRKQMFSSYIQSSNQNDIFKEATGFSATVLVPEMAGQMLERAFKEALGGNRAAHLAIPKDVQSMEYSGDIVPRPVFRAAVPKPDFQDIINAARLLEGCRKPLILAGYGTRGMGEMVTALAEKIGAGMILSSVAKGAVSERHPLVVGVVGDAGNEGSREMVQAADAILILGSTWWPEEYMPQDVKIIQADIDPKHLGSGKNISVSILGDTREIIPLLEREYRGSINYGWVEAVKMAKARRDRVIESMSQEDMFPVHPARLMLAIERVVPDNAVIAVDTGDITLWFASNFRATYQDVILSGMWRAMGFGLPAALGARTAFPDRPIIALCGDGGMGELLSELATAAQFKLPVVVLVAANNSWALEGYKQIAGGFEPTGIGFSEIDFVAAALAMGVEAMPVKNTGELEPVLEMAFASGKPFLVSVPTAAIPARELARTMEAPAFKPFDFGHPDMPI